MKKTEETLLVIDSIGTITNREEIAKEGKINLSNLGGYLKELFSQGYIEKTGYGEYKISQKGKEKAKELKQNYKETPELIENDTLENFIHICSRYKKEMGSEKFGKAMESIKILIE